MRMGQSTINLGLRLHSSPCPLAKITSTLKPINNHRLFPYRCCHPPSLWSPPARFQWGHALTLSVGAKFGGGRKYSDTIVGGDLIAARAMLLQDSDQPVLELVISMFPMNVDPPPGFFHSNGCVRGSTSSTAFDAVNKSSGEREERKTEKKTKREMD